MKKVIIEKNKNGEECIVATRTERETGIKYKVLVPRVPGIFAYLRDKEAVFVTGHGATEALLCGKTFQHQFYTIEADSNEEAIAC